MQQHRYLFGFLDLDNPRRECENLKSECMHATHHLIYYIYFRQNLSTIFLVILQHTTIGILYMQGQAKKAHLLTKGSLCTAVGNFLRVVEAASSDDCEALSAASAASSLSSRRIDIRDFGRAFDAGYIDASKCLEVLVFPIVKLSTKAIQVHLHLASRSAQPSSSLMIMQDYRLKLLVSFGEGFGDVLLGETGPGPSGRVRVVPVLKPENHSALVEAIVMAKIPQVCVNTPLCGIMLHAWDRTQY